MIYVTGDTHGEIERFENRRIRSLGKKDCLIICGDFGFIWENSPKEKALLHKIGSKRYKTLFIDGTHENFDLLSAYPVTELYGGKVHHISGNLYHLMRGEIYTIEGKTFFAFGGGESMDKDFRQENGTWWKAEQPTEEEIAYAAHNLEKHQYTVDYIITHQPSMNDMGMVTGRRKVSRLSAFFETLSQNVRYQKWYFGSLHQDKVLRHSQCLFTEVEKIIG